MGEKPWVSLPAGSAETRQEKPAHLSSALIPGGRAGRQGRGLSPKPPLLGRGPAVGAPPSRGRSSKARPHPCPAEAAREGWGWEAPGCRPQVESCGERGAGKGERGAGKGEMGGLLTLMG